MAKRRLLQLRIHPGHGLGWGPWSAYSTTKLAEILGSRDHDAHWISRHGCWVVQHLANGSVRQKSAVTQPHRVNVCRQ